MSKTWGYAHCSTNEEKHYPAYVAKQMNVSELARVCGPSRPTVYKYLNLLAY